MAGIARPLEKISPGVSAPLTTKAQLWPARTAFCKSLVFTVEGQSIPVKDPDLALELLGLLNTPLVRLSLNKYCGQHKYSGYVNLFPYRRLPDSSGTRTHVKSAIAAHLEARIFDESQSVFSILFYGTSIREYVHVMTRAIETAWDVSAACEAFC